VADVRFETELASGLYLNARTNEVQQIFVNLIKNAAEAVNDRYGDGAPGVGRVRIATGRTETGVWATVSDNGGGIPDEKRRVIFDPFYTTKPPGRGTGLGLNIVYRIVTKYRGTIQVQSELPRDGVGGGTTFELRFPVEQ
jgi:signal transduction histidine kinase